MGFPAGELTLSSSINYCVVFTEIPLSSVGKCLSAWLVAVSMMIKLLALKLTGIIIETLTIFISILSLQFYLWESNVAL